MTGWDDLTNRKKTGKGDAPAQAGHGTDNLEGPESKLRESAYADKGSLLSWQGAFGTVKGVVLGAGDLASGLYHAVVNPDVEKLNKQIAFGQKPDVNQFGFLASFGNTASEMGTSLAYVKQHGLKTTVKQLWSQEVQNYQLSSSEGKGIAVGKSIFLVGSMVWGTGLGTKFVKMGRDVLGLSRAEEGLATLGAAGDSGKETQIVKGLAQDAKSGEARVVDKGDQVLPRTGGRQRFDFLKEGNQAQPDAVQQAHPVELVETSRLASGANVSENRALLTELRATRRLIEERLASRLGHESDLGAGMLSQGETLLARQTKKVRDALTAVENAGNTEARAAKFKDLRAAVEDYNLALPTGSKNRILPKEIDNFESAIGKAPKNISLSKFASEPGLAMEAQALGVAPMRRVAGEVAEGTPAAGAGRNLTVDERELQLRQTLEANARRMNQAQIDVESNPAAAAYERSLQAYQSHIGRPVSHMEVNLPGETGHRSTGISARLDEAARLNDPVVLRRVEAVDLHIKELSSVWQANVSHERIEAAAANLRQAVRNYNEAIDFSIAARGRADDLKVSESIADIKLVSASSERLANTTPSLYGYGSRQFLDRATGTPGSLPTRVDGLYAQHLGPESAHYKLGKAALDGALEQANKSAFRDGMMVLGLASAKVLKAYFLADDIYLAKSFTFKEVAKLAGNSAVDSDPSSRSLSPMANPMRLEQSRGTGTATVSGATGPAFHDTAPGIRLVGGTADKGPAFSAAMQAFALPKPDLQATHSRQTYPTHAELKKSEYEEKKKKPGWWNWYSQGSNRIGPVLLKGDESLPEDKRIVFAGPPTRRIVSGDPGSQRIVTPTFDPRYVRMQSELLAASASIKPEARMLLAGGVDRKARGKGYASPDEEKLTSLFPFLLKSASLGETGMVKVGLKLKKAEDQEHKNMGKFGGTSAGQTGATNNQDMSASLTMAAASSATNSNGINDESKSTSSV